MMMLEPISPTGNEISDIKAPLSSPKALSDLRLTIKLVTLFFGSLGRKQVNTFHQKVYTWCCGLILYILIIEKMLSKQI